MYMCPNRIEPPALPAPTYDPPYSIIMQDTGRYVISQYLGIYIYVWLLSGEAFWMCPTQIRYGFVYGFIWCNYEWIYSCIPKMLINCLY